MMRMAQWQDRLDALAGAGLVRFMGDIERHSVIEHVSQRVRLEQIKEDDVVVTGGFWRVVVDSVNVPVTYFSKPGPTRVDTAALEHFVALCDSLGLLPGPWKGMALEPNAHSEPGSYATWSNRDLRVHATRFARNNDDGSKWFFNPAAEECAYVEAYPLDRLLGENAFRSRADAAEWLAGEIRDCYVDGLDYRAQAYAKLMGEAVDEPIVVCDGWQDVRLWDGYHRVAVSLCKGAQQIRAIVVQPGAERLRVVPLQGAMKAAEQRNKCP